MVSNIRDSSDSEKVGRSDDMSPKSQHQNMSSLLFLKNTLSIDCHKTWYL